MEEKIEKEIETPAASPTVEQLLEEIQGLKNNTVDKAMYDKLVEDSKKLAKEVTENRPVPKQTEEPTKVQVLARIQDRTDNLSTKTSLEAVTALTQNYRDMRKLGMDVPTVDEKIVANLEYIVQEAKGDKDVFDALMSSRVK